MFGRVLQLRARHRRFPQHGIGEDLVQFADRLIALAGHEVARIDAIDIGEPDQNLNRDRPLIALHQVQIARRDVEILGHAGLGQLAVAAQALEAWPGEDFAGERVNHCQDFTD